MTGPEHYREAEQLLRDAIEHFESEERSRVLQSAQVHATLALAAAVGGLDAREGPGGGSATGHNIADSRAWYQVTRTDRGGV